MTHFLLTALVALATLLPLSPAIAAVPKYVSQSGRQHLYELDVSGRQPKVRRVLSIDRAHIVSWRTSSGRFHAVIRDRDGKQHAYSGNAVLSQAANGLIPTDALNFAPGSPIFLGSHALIMEVRKQAFEPLARRGLLLPDQQRVMHTMYGISQP